MSHESFQEQDRQALGKQRIALAVSNLTALIRTVQHTEALTGKAYLMPLDVDARTVARVSSNIMDFGNRVYLPALTVETIKYDDSYRLDKVGAIAPATDSQGRNFLKCMRPIGGYPYVITGFVTSRAFEYENVVYPEYEQHQYLLDTTLRIIDADKHRQNDFAILPKLDN